MPWDMSPEQARAAMSTSLSVVLYEMSTGKAPLTSRFGWTDIDSRCQSN